VRPAERGPACGAARLPGAPQRDSEAPRGTQVVRRWEYGLLSDASSVTYVQVPADIRGGHFRFWDPREHDWSIIHRAQVPPPTREIATEARPGRRAAPCRRHIRRRPARARRLVCRVSRPAF